MAGFEISVHRVGLRYHLIVANRTSTGTSSASDTMMAVAEAFDMASAALGRPPVLCLVFAGPDRDLTIIDRELRRLAPGAVRLGCHTAGEFTERGFTHGSVSLMLIASDEFVVNGASASGTHLNPLAVASALAKDWDAVSVKAADRGLGAVTSILLVDGLAGSGDRIVKEYQSKTRLLQQIVGGAAGDEGRFKATGVLGNEGVTFDGAAAVQLFSRTPWGAGAGHGLVPASKRMRVTKAKGSSLIELDGRPAIEAYRAHAAQRGVTLTSENQGRFLIENEIGVLFLDSLHHARAPVGVEPDGTLRLVADITEGATVCILEGEPAAMVEACAKAARDAKANLRESSAAGVLVFDCVCRGMILGDQFEREIDAVRSTFPGVPLLGFLTYGEVARFGGRLDGWHNTTSVVAAIPS